MRLKGKHQELNRYIADGMDISQLANDKSTIDTEHDAAVEQVNQLHHHTGNEEIDSCSGGASATQTGATHSTGTGDDNNCVYSVTTLVLKTTYKTNKVDLALTKAEVARKRRRLPDGMLQLQHTYRKLKPSMHSWLH